MTPVLAGRLQTRLFVAAILGVLWTAVVTPLLPVPPGTGIATTYRMTFENLALMAGLGLLWEMVYHLVQQLRWDKDWPTLLGLLTVVNEAIPLWFVGHWSHILPGTVNLTSPLFPAFAIHVGTTWLVMWLFVQGPVRVLLVRWRFEGGRVLRRITRTRRTDDWLDTQWLESLRSEQPHQLPVMADQPADVVALNAAESSTDRYVPGARCPNGHFGNPAVRYCVTCGAAVPPQPPVLGPRPPLGMLITADGASHVLDGDLSVMVTDDVLSFQANEDDASNGPALADIRIVGWQPVASSATRPIAVLLPNGTRLGVAVNVPVPLVPGAALVVGGHVARYDSPYGPDTESTPRREPATRAIAPVGPQTTTVARRLAAAAAMMVVAGAVTFVIVDGSSDGGRRAGIRPPSVVPPPLSSFSVPPWTLPSQTPGASTPLLPIGPTASLPVPLLPPPPEPVLGPLPPISSLPGTSPAPTSPSGTTTPPVPTSPTSPPPGPPPPASPVPTTALCTVDLLGLAQCAAGMLGGG
ncbi:MAG TPA: hypothetical protein VFW65_14170 [Pseudonocardiaceae bacterium]|nr:hypothetical protein [Pseudonocardiaceae bacterium]